MAELILGVLASIRATDLQAVIDAIESKKLDARVACVISNKKDAYALERAKKHGIEAIFLNPEEFGSREEFDERVVKLLNERNVQLVLLISYNRFMSKPFLKAFENRAMNIHPSLLPSFKGWDKSVHQRVIDSGVKLSGCTLFFINGELDCGPIIAQKPVPVEETETVESLKAKVQKAEQELILQGIKLFHGKKLAVEGNRVRILG